MKALNLITLCLVIIGGLNWGLVGVLDLDLVSAIFGELTAASRVVYVLVGLSALWQIYPFAVATRVDEPRAEAGAR